MDGDLSLAAAFDAVCPLCGTAFQGQRWLVADLDHRPELGVRAGDGSLQRSFCPACVGPGVEQAGTFGLVRRSGDRIQTAYFIPEGSTSFDGEIDSIDDRLRKRCEALGLPAGAIEPLGAGLFEGARDVRNGIGNRWPNVVPAVDPAMLQGPLLELLNAPDAAARAQALLAHPDLARPNIESFLGTLASRGNAAQQTAAIAARSFVAAARRIGVTAARQRAPEVVPPGLAIQRDPPRTPAEFAAAVSAYEQALAELAPDAAETRRAVLLALSAWWDLRPDGDHRDNVERALAHANEAVQVSAGLAEDLRAEALMEMGVLYTKRPSGDPSSNLLLARQALDQAVELADTPSLRMLARYNHALTFVEDDAPGSSLDTGIAILQLLARPENLGDFTTAQQQNLFQSLGFALAKRTSRRAEAGAADFDQAAGFVRRAMELAEARGEPYELARNASLLAQIEADRRRRGRTDSDLADILALVDRAAGVFTYEAAPFEFARNELRRAGILEDLAEPDLAAPWIIRALENACRVLTPDGFPDLCRRAQFALGRLRRQAGDLRSAALAFSTAADASEQILAATETVSRRAAEVEPNAILYGELVDTLARLAVEPGTEDAADASWRVLEAMERGRARLYLDLLSLRPLPPFPGVPEELRARESSLVAQLAWSMPGAAQGSDPAGAMDAERLLRQREVRAALQSLWDEIAACGEGGRRHASLRRSRPPDRTALAVLASSLGPRAATVSFFVLPDRVLAVRLRDGAPPKVRRLPVSAAELREGYLASFAGDVLAPHAPATAPHAWRGLGDVLFGPFVDELADLDLLVVLPHGDLHALPLHALAVSGRPLIEHVAVSYAPSLGVLAAVRGGDDHARGGVGTALVLSHAEKPEEAEEMDGEARAVARLFGTAAHHHAERATVTRAAPEAGLIHLACHGYFDAADPLASGVILADGVMTARDWLVLPLHADLVTLSACETGQQQVRQGDELVGLARALLQAGSAGVLLTLWRVYSDSTADWMGRFYAALAESPKPSWPLARAFQRATLALRADDPDPRAWAPFVLLGDPR
jgi:CHAT domain-containing protein